MIAIAQRIIDTSVRRALEEDIGSGDLTSEGTLSPELKGTAEFVAKESFLVCGVEIVTHCGAAADLPWCPGPVPWVAPAAPACGDVAEPVAGLDAQEVELRGEVLFFTVPPHEHLA